MILILIFFSLFPFNLAQVACPVSPGSFNEGIDYFDQNKLDIEFSEKLQISYHGYYKQIIVKDGPIFILYLCNTRRPNVMLNDAVYIEIPLQNVAVTDLQVLGYLERLGVQASIKAVSNTLQIASDCLNVLIDQKLIQNLTTTNTNTLDFVFGPFNDLKNSSSLHDHISQDPHPLGRAEWIKFFAMFWNLDLQSEIIFEDITLNYRCHSLGRESVHSKESIIVVKKADGPTWNFLDKTYFQTLIENSGAHYIAAPEDSMAVSPQFHSVLKSASFVIDETENHDNQDHFEQDAGIIGQSKDDGYAFLGLLGQLWKLDRARGPHGADYFDQTSWSRPEIVLADLIHAQDKTWIPSFKHVYFRNIARGDNFYYLSSSQCTDPFKPVKIQNTCRNTNNFDPIGNTGRTMPVAIIAGIVSGVVALILAVVGIIFILKRRKPPVLHKNGHGVPVRSGNAVINLQTFHTTTTPVDQNNA